MKLTQLEHMAVYVKTELKFGILEVLKLQENERVTGDHFGFRK